MYNGGPLTTRGDEGQWERRGQNQFRFADGKGENAARDGRQGSSNKTPLRGSRFELEEIENSRSKVTQKKTKRTVSIGQTKFKCEMKRGAEVNRTKGGGGMEKNAGRKTMRIRPAGGRSTSNQIRNEGMVGRCFGAMQRWRIRVDRGLW